MAAELEQAADGHQAHGRYLDHVVKYGKASEFTAQPRWLGYRHGEEAVKVMGQKWTATLKVEFELQDGQPPHRAANVLRGAVAQFRLNMVTGHMNGRVKPGSPRSRFWSNGPLILSARIIW